LQVPDIGETILDALVVDVVAAGLSDYNSINEVVEALFKHMGWKPEEFEYLADKQVCVNHSSVDTTWAETQLNWSLLYTLGDWLARTIDWYIGYPDRAQGRENLETLLQWR